MTTISEELISQLVARGVDTVFGIPGVHTIELYRGLGASGIRHITPRHEQGAGFMADGYARVTGRPGVAFIITGPGVTNTLTAMGQARADSIPMLVISGVNATNTLGRGMGHLHELPDQRAMAATVALHSFRIESSDDLMPALDKAYACFTSARPGPVHIEVPLDVAGAYFVSATPTNATAPANPDNTVLLKQAARLLEKAQRPVILAGGGAKHQTQNLRALAEAINAPVVQTINARGLMYEHPLSVPASPSLNAVRALIEDADTVLAVGTELGTTDYDLNETGELAGMAQLIRIDICDHQLQRRDAQLRIREDAGSALKQLNSEIKTSGNDGTGSARAARARDKAVAELRPDMRELIMLLNVIRDSLPGSIMVGDSAQPLYAGNYYYDHDRPGAWFNAATGFGALGYAIPAAIGAAIADSAARVVCIVGDGGAQFSLPELMAAKDEKLRVLYIIWNNHGYLEIESWMKEAGVTVVGCDPSPPDFKAVAASCFMPYEVCAPDASALKAALASITSRSGPAILEITAS